MSIAGSDGRVDADELMDVLTAALSRDLRNNVLEKDTCRALIQLVDKDRVGSLNCEQCTLLIENICRWKRVFISVVENRSETISRHQVSNYLCYLCEFLIYWICDNNYHNKYYNLALLGSSRTRLRSKYGMSRGYSQQIFHSGKDNSSRLHCNSVSC